MITFLVPLALLIAFVVGLIFLGNYLEERRAEATARELLVDEPDLDWRDLVPPHYRSPR